MSPVPWRAVVALLAVLWTVVVAWVLTTPSAWATHTPAPVPSLAPGQGLVGTGWTCHGTTSATTGLTTQDCQIAGWRVLPAPSPEPAPTLLLPNPLPVQEISPRPVDQSTHSYQQTITNYEACGGGGATQSPGPSGASSSPSPEPAATSTADFDEACTVKLVNRQWIIGGLFAAVFLVLGLVGFVRREAKGLTT